MLNNLSVGKAGSRRACACPRSRVVCVCVQACGRGTRREGTVPRRYSYGTIAAMSSDQQLAASMQTD